MRYLVLAAAEDVYQHGVRCFFYVWKDLAAVHHCSGTAERVQQG